MVTFNIERIFLVLLCITAITLLQCTTPSLFYHIFWYLKCFVAKVAYSHAAPSSPSHVIYLQDRAGLVREWETGWAFCCEATALTTAPPKT